MPQSRDTRIWHKAARALSGHERLNVIFLNGSYQTTRGRFSKHEDKFGVYGFIQLSSSLDENQLLRTFLHEVAHAKHHWDSTLVTKLEPEIIQKQIEYLQTTLKTTKVQTGEKVADKQRDEWLEIINSIMPETYWTNEQKLIALVKYVQRLQVR